MDQITPKAKSPADFQAVADAFNGDIAKAHSARAACESNIADLNKRREDLIGQASDYGVTGKYARALLRK